MAKPHPKAQAIQAEHHQSVSLTEFTLAEFLAFIGGEQKETPEGFYTADEWAEHFGINIKRMRELLKRAKAKGLLEIDRAQRIALDDKPFSVPVYSLKRPDVDFS